MIKPWPSTLPLRPASRGYSEQFQDSRRVFTPEYGPDITAPRTTADIVFASVSFPPLATATMAEVRSFYQSDLRSGSLAFAWRDPIGGALRKYKMVEPPSISQAGSLRASFSMQVARLPGVPWFFPYATQSGNVRLPVWVADWTNEVYGVDQKKTALSALSAISGTFDVLVATSGGTEFQELTFAGDIPTTAPVGVLWYAGFAQ